MDNHTLFEVIESELGVRLPKIEKKKLALLGMCKCTKLDIVIN